MEDQQYYIPDLETGFKVRVTKEQHDKFMKMWESVQPKIVTFQGDTILVGTAGSFNSNGSFEEIFYNPEKYKFK